MNFENCIEIVLKHEGEYSFDANDPGGETHWGISKRAYPNLDIKNLTLANAKQIYKIDYWDRMHCEFFHPAIRLMVLDCSINQGVKRCTLFLQKCAGIEQDGILGPYTVNAIRVMDVEFLILKISRMRLESYKSNPHLPYFGAGWATRLLDVTGRSFVYLLALNTADSSSNMRN